MKRIISVLFALALPLLFVAVIQVWAAPSSGIVVNTALDEEIDNADCSLREAIVAANTDAAFNGCAGGGGEDTITFAGDYTITLTDQLPAITTTIKISGNGPKNTIIQANASPNVVNYRVFAILGYEYEYDVTDNGDLRLNGLTIRNGKADGTSLYSYMGGGILNYDGNLRLTDVSVEDNISELPGYVSYGGGVALERGNTKISGTTFRGNSAGAVIVNNGRLSVANSTFFDNSADVTPYPGTAAIDGSNSPITITNSTIYSNTGGFIVLSQNAPFVLQNTIIAHNTGPDCTIVNNIGITATHNLIEDTLYWACEISNGVNGNLIGTDPLLGPFGDNGGPTNTLSPLIGSPAIDAGDDTICASHAIGSLDQRGVVRPVGAACDIGAVEALKQIFLPLINK
jgi:CSLREA domain-containing protein